LGVIEVFSSYEMDLDVRRASSTTHAAHITRDAALSALVVFCAVFALQVWSKTIAFWFPVGGREAFPWPAFVLPSIEAAMLAGGVGAFTSFVLRARFPALASPIFDIPDFETTSAGSLFAAFEASERALKMLQRGEEVEL